MAQQLSNQRIAWFNGNFMAIGVGIDGHRLDAEPSRSLDHPAGDLAAIGDQDLGKHQTAHLGLRLSKNARMPSSASSVVH